MKKHPTTEPGKDTALINNSQNEGFFTYGALMEEQDPTL